MSIDHRKLRLPLLISLALLSTACVVQPGYRHSIAQQPSHNHIDRWDYYYYPDVEVYYSYSSGYYFYYSDGNWITSLVLPSYFILDHSRRVKLRIENERPYIYHKTYREKYRPKKPSRTIVVPDRDHRHERKDHQRERRDYDEQQGRDRRHDSRYEEKRDRRYDSRIERKHDRDYDQQRNRDRNDHEYRQDVRKTQPRDEWREYKQKSDNQRNNERVDSRLDNRPNQTPVKPEPVRQTRPRLPDHNVDASQHRLSQGNSRVAPQRFQDVKRTKEQHHDKTDHGRHQSGNSKNDRDKKDGSHKNKGNNSPQATEKEDNSEKNYDGRRDMDRRNRHDR